MARRLVGTSTIAIVGLMGIVSGSWFSGTRNRAMPVNRIILTFGLFLLLSAYAGEGLGLRGEGGGAALPDGQLRAVGHKHQLAAAREPGVRSSSW